MHLGFSTLRELVVMRPSVRYAALDVLLGLCTHAGTTSPHSDDDAVDTHSLPLADKRFRNAAITTVKKWVPDVPDLSHVIRDFALSLLARLTAHTETATAAPDPDGNDPTIGAVNGDGEADMATDASPPASEPPALCAQVRDGAVAGNFDPPATLEGVTQNVELLLALCVKDTTLLRP
jgi:symplekin